MWWQVTEFDITHTMAKLFMWDYSNGEQYSYVQTFKTMSMIVTILNITTLKHSVFRPHSFVSAGMPQADCGIGDILKCTTVEYFPCLYT